MRNSDSSTWRTEECADNHSMAKEDTPLYHWSPAERRRQINKTGLVPGSWSTDRFWKPPVICLASNPQLAWALSGGTARGAQHAEWDLWQVWMSDLNGYEEIVDYYKNSDQTYIKEYRVYHRIYKKDVWYVATRIR